MSVPFGTQWRETEPLTDEQIRELALDGDTAAWDHFYFHTPQQPDPGCQHCYWVGRLAHLDPLAERYSR